MSQPFIFISTTKIKEGKLEELRKEVHDLCQVVESNEPRLIAFNTYVDDDGKELTVVQMHPDADSMLFHMQVVREHITRAYVEVLGTTTNIQIYGAPTEEVLGMVRQLAGSDVPLTIHRTGIGGFTRSTAKGGSQL